MVDAYQAMLNMSLPQGPALVGTMAQDPQWHVDVHILQMVQTEEQEGQDERRGGEMEASGISAFSSTYRWYIG